MVVGVVGVAVAVVAVVAVVAELVADMLAEKQIPVVARQRLEVARIVEDSP